MSTVAKQQTQQQTATSTTASAQRKVSTSVPVPKSCSIPGKRRFTVWSSDFEVDDKYEPIKAIGKGAYGVVCSARDGKDKVAIKRIQNAFENEIDARRTLREMLLLRQLKHENIVHLRDVMKPASPDMRQFKDVYLVYELMDTDLHQIIRSKQHLSDDHFQYFVYQILRGLKYIHSANVLHRDLKPSNLLLNASCDLKICDFGLARTGEASPFMTDYVVTRWYRAPELLLNSDCYTPAIDIWSVGCIIAELLDRRPLFPGRSYVDQLRLIVRFLGMPSDEDMAFIQHEKARGYIETQLRGAEGSDASMQRHFKGANPLAVDLMMQMLRFNPAKRIDVNAALEHPYLAALHDPAAEPTSDRTIQVGFEQDELSGPEVRERIYEEICNHYGSALST